MGNVYGVSQKMREDHTPARVSTYGTHQVHHWVDIGLVVNNGVTTQHYKCSGCPQERFVPKHQRTWP